MLPDVPELVRQRALANGAAGQAWLDELPTIVASLTSRWNLRLGSVYMGGTAGYVVSAIQGEDIPCVLKVAMPLDIDEADTVRRAIAVHQLANGAGCARLLQADHEAPALLLEQLGPNLADLALPLPDMFETITRTLMSFWRPLAVAADQERFPTAADKANWLAEFIAREWQQLDRPCSTGVVERAVAYCHDRAAAFDVENAVLCHGDAHGWNTVRAGRHAYKFVDPEGVWAERALDLAVPMREYNEPLLAGDTPALVRARAERLGAACDVDVDAIWKWGFIERVSTGLANVRDFDGEEARGFLEVAERCI